jgi:hypothetical protein
MSPVSVMFSAATVVALVCLLWTQIKRIRSSRSRASATGSGELWYLAGPVGLDVAVAGLLVLTFMTLDEGGPILSLRTGQAGYALMIWLIFTVQICAIIILARLAAAWIILGVNRSTGRTDASEERNSPSMHSEGAKD